MRQDDKAFVALLVAFIIVSAYMAASTSLISDEGTHLLLAAMYKDIVGHAMQSGDFSFSSAYNLGIDWLVHYPKLQIAYPPVYHLTTAAVFAVTGLSEAAGRAIAILYAAGAVTIFYLLVSRRFGTRTALFAAFLFAFSTFTLFYAGRAMQDSAMLFWLLASVAVFEKAVRNGGARRAAMTGVVTALAALSKQLAGIVVLPYMGWLLKERRWKEAAALVGGFALLMVPYLLVLNAVNGFEINKLVAIGYAAEQGEPTSLFDPAFWTWYLVKPLAWSPLMLLFIIGLGIYAWQKRPQWKYLLGGFLMFFLLVTLIPNKEPRLVQLALLPAYVATASLLSKVSGWRLLLPAGLVVAYLLTSYFFMALTVVSYPAADVAKLALAQGGNIAVLSDADPLFSSIVMWEVAKLDANRSVAVYRGCTFDGLTEEQAAVRLKEAGIGSAIYARWGGPGQLEVVRDKLDLVGSMEAGGKVADVYKVRQPAMPSLQLCNYICLTGQKVCAG
jgi:4-amino-4-deoxy-L-arabinose transferase-like glycosyltransferase